MCRAFTWEAEDLQSHLSLWELKPTPPAASSRMMGQPAPTPLPSQDKKGIEHDFSTFCVKSQNIRDIVF